MGVFRKLYGQYRRNSEERSVPFEIQFEPFCKLLESPCYYCGIEASNTYFGYRYNGIDRLNNGLGYIHGNCQACCRKCNSIKGEWLTSDEMLAVILALEIFRSDCPD